MQNVILVIHILASIVLTALVLLQKSEGGGLGLGGGGGGGANSIMSGRGTAGALVRTTIMIGALFFATSLTLTSLASRGGDRLTEVERTLGGDEVPLPGQPGDLFDPSTPLLEGQQGVIVTEPAEAPVPESSTDLVDPTASAPPEGEPETGGPQ